MTRTKQAPKLMAQIEAAWKRYSKASWIALNATATTGELKEEDDSRTALLDAIYAWQHQKHGLCPMCSGMCVNYGTGTPCGVCGGTGRRSEKWRWKESKGDPSSPDPWWKPCAVCGRNLMLWDRGPAMNALLPKKLRTVKNLCTQCFREAVGAKDPRGYEP